MKNIDPSMLLSRAAASQQRALEEAKRARKFLRQAKEVEKEKDRRRNAIDLRLINEECLRDAKFGQMILELRSARLNDNAERELFGLPALSQPKPPAPPKPEAAADERTERTAAD